MFVIWFMPVDVCLLRETFSHNAFEFLCTLQTLFRVFLFVLERTGRRVFRE